MDRDAIPIMSIDLFNSPFWFERQGRTANKFEALLWLQVSAYLSECSECNHNRSVDEHVIQVVDYGELSVNLDEICRKWRWDSRHETRQFLSDLLRSGEINTSCNELIRQIRHGGIRRKPCDWDNIRLSILMRDENKCRYCGSHADTVDHIVPIAQGGGESDENLVASCRSCNSKKKARKPEEAGMEFLY